MTGKKINLIFTRDFDQWAEEIIRNSLVIGVKKIWGKGLSDQIVYFDGVTFHWYRYQADMDQLKSFLINKPSNSEIFSRVAQNQFLALVKDLRATAGLTNKEIRDDKKHLITLTSLFKGMYPYYPLGIFIAGPWREDFLKIHGAKGRAVLKILVDSREQSEGILKVVGLHLRTWLGPKLQEHNYPAEYVRLMTVREIKNFVENQKLPPLSVLRKRSDGYVYANGSIECQPNFKKFLSAHNLWTADLDPIKNKNNVAGQVACAGKVGEIIKGTVQKISNSFEVKNFKTGRILVTPMTSPEYILAMKKSLAIVTDEGGLTCHAAIVARELGKPCLIGTKFSTKMFNNGDQVEINIHKGLIRKVH